MVLLELGQCLPEIDRRLDSPQVNQPCMQAKGHGKRDSRGFAAAENRADSRMPVPELHAFAYVRYAQNSVPEHSVQVLPHSVFVQRDRAMIRSTW